MNSYKRELLDESCEAMMKTIIGATDNELIDALNEINKLSETNCWWIVYDCRTTLESLIVNEIKKRKRASLKELR